MTESKKTKQTPVEHKAVEQTPAKAKPANPAPSATPAAPQQAQVVTKSGGKGLSVFAVLLSLVALGGSGFTWYQNQVLGVQEESKLAVGVGEIGSQISRLGDSVERLKQDQADVVSNAEFDAKFLRVETEIETRLNSMDSQQKEMTDSMLQLQAELKRGVDQFTLEEVSQLLRLANNSVSFNQDVNSAVSALNLADNQLKGLQDPRFTAVRKEINSELAELNNVVLPDVEALSAQINVLAKSIPALPLVNEPKRIEETQQETQAPVTEQELTVRGELVKIWRDLISSVSIQRVEQPPKPLLVPEQRYFLNQNIILALSKAELALMQGQSAAYQRSLNDAQTWLREYFDLNDTKVSNALAQIAELAEQPVTVEVPPITRSYQALQTILGGQ